MGVQFLPDSYQKMNRYRSSLAKARATVSIASPEDQKGRKAYGIQLASGPVTYYGSIKERRKSVPFQNYRTSRQYPQNLQFWIRFFGTMHHHQSHGPEKAGRRWKAAWTRFNKWPSHRRISTRALNRIHPWS
jgi:hypothetical protein